MNYAKTLYGWTLSRWRTNASAWSEFSVKVAPDARWIQVGTVIGDKRVFRLYIRGTLLEMSMTRLPDEPFFAAMERAKLTLLALLCKECMGIGYVNKNDHCQKCLTRGTSARARG